MWRISKEEKCRRSAKMTMMMCAISMGIPIVFHISELMTMRLSPSMMMCSARKTGVQSRLRAEAVTSSSATSRKIMLAVVELPRTDLSRLRTRERLNGTKLGTIMTSSNNKICPTGANLIS
uniref:Fgenesh protein 19 n=1 Tax=Beta vulgaris TaxID=161934 RepID=Q20CE7_BETVU|nr:Fgenesh protein 19 [Beta vulgaris]